jgi:ATP-binding cassette subfamily F protein 3
MIVSHDRQMLNAVVHRIVEVEQRKLSHFTGNYERYLQQKILRREQQQADYNRQQEYIRKEQAWIDRFRYKATKARQAQSRIKRLEKLEIVEAPQNEMDTANFSMGEVVRSGAVVLDVRGASMAYGDLQLYSDVSFQVERGERVGIIGPNGSGKTTLLRQLAGLHDGTAGEIRPGHKVELGFYAQNHETMNPANDVLTEVQTARPVWTPGQIRTFLGKLLFSGDDAFKSVSVLSGGELSRVAMAKLMLGTANVLLLDEPTNHLDIASREALEAAIEVFPGSVVMVSHDRALIDRFVDKLVIIENGHGHVHLGNYAHYRWKQDAPREERGGKSTGDVLKIRRDKPQGKRSKAQQRDERKKQRQIEDLEQTIEGLEELIQGFDARFAALDPADYKRAEELKGEYEGMKADLKELFEQWESLND